MPAILFVDDEAIVRQNYEMLLKHHGFDVTLASNVEDAMKALQHSDFDLVITDMRMAPHTGLDLLRRVKQSSPQTEVIVLTGHADMQNAVEAMKLGALDYLTKETDYSEILITVEKAIEKKQLREEVERLKSRIRTEFVGDKLIGESPVIRTIRETIKRVAPTGTRVLITGESGTGKELVAETIHEQSARRDRPFVAINCAAIPSELEESELFGHVRGAFTGAEKDRKGLLETAAGGTVFLDEIADMSLDTQAKLLRFLETGEMYAVGSSTPKKVDVRVIAASNKKLEESVANNQFREDLFYRLKVVVIHLPPLRERTSDIPLIALELLKHLGARTRTNILSIGPEAEQALMEYGWPGNVRELKNVLERALIFSDKDRIEIESLPEEIFAPIPQKDPNARIAPGSIQSLDEIEKKYILDTLHRLGGNKLLTAQTLSIATTTLYRKLRQYGIE